MKQLLQNLKSGETELANIPAPAIIPGRLLIQSNHSIISAGTERMLVEFSKANLIDKARKQPEKVKMVLEKIQSDGLFATLDAVQSKLDHSMPLGYSNAGVVIDVGKGVNGFSIGDRVISNGNHAEVVSVPKNLCTKIPDSVSFEHAAFTVIASIALQGIRLLQPTLGESIAVTGLGLVGLLTVQLLAAHGCRVLGIDFDDRKIELARQYGAETVRLSADDDPLDAARHFSRGRGMDGVIIAASTKSTDPIKQAAEMSRQRGRIVLVGVTGLELSRSEFYAKELSFCVSCSYGPGRYDSQYEEKGNDYPVGYVRWTENRNFEAVLDMMDKGRIDVASLISHRFPFNQAKEAYRLLTSEEPSLGIVLEYPDAPEADWRNDRSVKISATTKEIQSSGKARVGILGAGNFATRTLLPVLHQQGADIKMIASQGGVNGVHAARKFGISEAVSDSERIFTNAGINTVFVLTQHHSHAGFVIDSLKRGKHVFVEKPLALTLQELDEIDRAYCAIEQPPVLMLGFNRRFAPHIRAMKPLLDSASSPKSFIFTVNAGSIPSQHWTQDPNRGGGRIIGEACHFVDLLRFLSGSKIQAATIHALGNTQNRDTASIQLQFCDGSIGSIHYFANGNKAFPKERLEVFSEGRILQLDNFRTLRGYGWPGAKKMKRWKQDKGHSDEIEAFLHAVENGGPLPIPFEEMIEVSRVCIQLANGTNSGHEYGEAVSDNV